MKAFLFLNLATLIHFDSCVKSFLGKLKIVTAELLLFPTDAAPAMHYITGLGLSHCTKPHLFVWRQGTCLIKCCPKSITMKYI